MKSIKKMLGTTSVKAVKNLNQVKGGAQGGGGDIVIIRHPNGGHSEVKTLGDLSN